MTDETLQAQVTALAARVRELEDRQEIAQLIGSYGPGVDSVSPGALERMWTEDGVYDPSGSHYTGNETIAGLVFGDLHQGYVAAGCAHVLSQPVVHLHGDTAVAINYSRVYLRDGDGWRVARVSANRWTLVRAPEGWKVTLRTGRLLDGSEDARNLLADNAS